MSRRLQYLIASTIGFAMYFFIPINARINGGEMRTIFPNFEGIDEGLLMAASLQFVSALFFIIFRYNWIKLIHLVAWLCIEALVVLLIFDHSGVYVIRGWYSNELNEYILTTEWRIMAISLQLCVFAWLLYLHIKEIGEDVLKNTASKFVKTIKWLFRD